MSQIVGRAVVDLVVPGKWRQDLAFPAVDRQFRDEAAPVGVVRYRPWGVADHTLRPFHLHLDCPGRFWRFWTTAQLDSEPANLTRREFAIHQPRNYPGLRCVLLIHLGALDAKQFPLLVDLHDRDFPAAPETGTSEQARSRTNIKGLLHNPVAHLLGAPGNHHFNCRYAKCRTHRQADNDCQR